MLRTVQDISDVSVMLMMDLDVVSSAGVEVAQ